MTYNLHLRPLRKLLSSCIALKMRLLILKVTHVLGRTRGTIFTGAGPLVTVLSVKFSALPADMNSLQVQSPELPRCFAREFFPRLFREQKSSYPTPRHTLFHRSVLISVQPLPGFNSYVVVVIYKILSQPDIYRLVSCSDAYFLILYEQSNCLR